MADRLTGVGRLLVSLAIAGAIVVATWVGYRHYTEHYAVTTDADGLAVARVVAGRLYGSNELRVSHLSGTVQSTAATTRMFGWLKYVRLIKAPYDVDYFVALGSLRPRDFRYDERRRTLLVEVPDVVVGTPNVDESRVTLDTTSGVLPTRAAMAELQKRVSAKATDVVAAKAREPENLARARDNGRAALERLFAGTLEAAGLPVRVEVRFAGEPRPDNRDRWDMTRSLDEVLGNSR
ncbi:hypothetical protein ASE95_10270 [Sphingomonas sp. Leaf231]|uniref:DUF4230 domain-containing protein n=1 Tax=Sphingomonas sp. Leaf231 TaxID=1736301 RepID=UPI0006FF6DC2|nr:DUF4230 domain-containing protein [Sphingomonas sp. Leaf231]KQN92975.1 hypothetical protein ASE95_10270 [Sphingomonas sp. Leaf231]